MYDPNTRAAHFELVGHIDNAKARLTELLLNGAPNFLAAASVAVNEGAKYGHLCEAACELKVPVNEVGEWLGSSQAALVAEAFTLAEPVSLSKPVSLRKRPVR